MVSGDWYMYIFIRMFTNQMVCCDWLTWTFVMQAKNMFPRQSVDAPSLVVFCDSTYSCFGNYQGS